MSEIELKDVCVLYSSKKREVRALDRFSATFYDGMNVIVGYSGCGKTTLLRTVAGLLDYDGEIFVDGEDIEETEVRDRNFSFVSQEYVLYPQYTVFENIAFPLKIMGAGRKEITERVKEIAEITELTACLTRKPRHISGGQQQRTAIARALVKKPSVCLMDEPFSNTDEATRTQMRRWVKNVFVKAGCMAIYVTHDFREALAMADHLYVMDAGRLAISGTPEEVFDSGNEVVESLKAGSFLE
ncbi:MAG: ABC transporter ATP-binding protein [Eubacteriales bacterium]